MKRALIDALQAKYEAEIAEAAATINIYLTNSVGIGEHTQVIDELDKQVQRIADAQEKIEVLKSFEPEKQAL